MADTEHTFSSNEEEVLYSELERHECKLL